MKISHNLQLDFKQFLEMNDSKYDKNMKQMANGHHSYNMATTRGLTFAYQELALKGRVMKDCYKIITVLMNHDPSERL